MTRKKTRFQEHCEEYLKSGGTGQLMRIEDVDGDDMSQIAGEIFRLAKTMDDPYQAYVSVISKYGIICPHPQKKRLYDGRHKSDVPVERYRWYDCTMCGCSAFNEHWMWRVRDEEKESIG
jgi:hypothetical protein